MAFSFRTYGGGFSKTSGTSFTLSNTLSTIPLGDLIIVAIAIDNIATSNGVASNLSISDSDANTWTKVNEWAFGSLGANNGAQVAMFWAIAKNSYGVGSITITFTLSSARTAKAYGFVALSRDTSKSVVVAAQQGANGTGSACTATLSSLTSSEYAFIVANAIEGTGAIMPVGFGNAVSTGTSGGSGVTNMSLALGYSIQTATSKTATNANTSDSALILAAFYEQTPGNPVINNKFFQFF